MRTAAVTNPSHFLYKNVSDAGPNVYIVPDVKPRVNKNVDNARKIFRTREKKGIDTENPPFILYLIFPPVRRVTPSTQSPGNIPHATTQNAYQAK